MLVVLWFFCCETGVCETGGIVIGGIVSRVPCSQLNQQQVPMCFQIRLYVSSVLGISCVFLFLWFPRFDRLHILLDLQLVLVELRHFVQDKQHQEQVLEVKHEIQDEFLMLVVILIDRKLVLPVLVKRGVCISQTIIVSQKSEARGL